MGKTLTVCIMEPPYEAASSTTAMRIIDSALRKGINVNVFAFEGAVSLSCKDQKPHPNPVHGTSVEEESHLLPARGEIPGEAVEVRNIMGLERIP